MGLLDFFDFQSKIPRIVRAQMNRTYTINQKRRENRDLELRQDLKERGAAELGRPRSKGGREMAIVREVRDGSYQANCS